MQESFVGMSLSHPITMCKAGLKVLESRGRGEGRGAGSQGLPSTWAAQDSPWGQRDSFRDRADPLPALTPTALCLGRVMQEKGLVGSCSGAEPPCPCPTAAPE